MLGPLGMVKTEWKYILSQLAWPRNSGRPFLGVQGRTGGPGTFLVSVFDDLAVPAPIFSSYLSPLTQNFPKEAALIKTREVEDANATALFGRQLSSWN